MASSRRAGTLRQACDEHRVLFGKRVRHVRLHELEAGVGEETSPGRLGKDAKRVELVDDPYVRAGLAQHDDELRFVDRVLGIVVTDPFEIAQRTTVHVVVASVARLRREELTRGVGNEYDDTSGS